MCTKKLCTTCCGELMAQKSCSVAQSESTQNCSEQCFILRLCQNPRRDGRTRVSTQARAVSSRHRVWLCPDCGITFRQESRPCTLHRSQRCKDKRLRMQC